MGGSVTQKEEGSPGGLGALGSRFGACSTGAESQALTCNGKILPTLDLSCKICLASLELSLGS